MIPFDELWYLQTYPAARRDIGDGLAFNAESHYHQIGVSRGYSPSSHFDESWYLATYPDAAEAVARRLFRSGFHHYLGRGAAEGRNPHASFDETAYLQSHPDAAAAVVEGRMLCGFEYYLLVGRFLGRGAGPLENSGVDLGGYQPVATDNPMVAPLHLRAEGSTRHQAHLNVVLPALRMSSMSGGPNTVLNAAYRLAAAGIPIRLISANTPIDSDTEALWTHLQLLTDIREKLPNVEFVDGSNAAAPGVVGEYDVFMGTAWWTVQMMAPYLSQMKQKTFFYFIQDFEPAFSAWSSEYCVALETYSMDYVPIFNTSVLRDYFIEKRIGRFADPEFSRQSIAFEPALDRRHFFPEARLPGQPFRLLFYARPRIGKRNLFEIALSALKRAADAGAFGGDWQLRYMGEPLPFTQLNKDVWIHPLAWLGLEEYAGIMRQSDVLLAPMLSPHPSYPPLEMSHCGGYVVTNSFETKSAERLEAYSPNIISCEPTVAGMAEALLTAHSLVSNRFPAVKFHSSLPSTWTESFQDVLPFIASHWTRLTEGAASALRK